VKVRCATPAADLQAGSDLLRSVFAAAYPSG
jgi:hypothetical protein